MKANLSFCLTWGLLIALVSAQAKLTDSWDMDSSCDGDRRKKLDDAFSDVVEMIRKARMDLYRVQEPRDNRKTSTSLSGTNWDRIARYLSFTFGLRPPNDRNQNGYDPEEENFKKVNYTMYGTLVQAEQLPAGGWH
ncbi:hypothetical protein NW762_006142 [Fusarium torreyae]|uniref:Uncharacterized protein n=1 Tax=Fusarium torreyae TaxID=1237075 RepID=A0A9W8RZZ7_9HYPO|nr:hypothetical protein NW762_006142 [Fusarium torreyae]